MDVINERFGYIEKDFLLDLYYDFGIKTDIKPFLKNQIGGGNTEERIIKFIDIGGIYTYTIYIEHQSSTDSRLSILNSNNDECVTIILNKVQRTAVLHNMSYYENCAHEGLNKLNNIGGGGKLLRFALNLILKYKEEYNITRILLKDNSFLYCKGFEHTIKLAQLRMFTHGLPWYSSYGFKPYDPSIQKPSIVLLDLLKNSRKIAKTLQTKKVNIIEIIKSNKLNYDIDKINTMIAKYPIMSDFIINLSNNYDEYCKLIYYILEYMFDNVMIKGLGNFHGKTFYLDI